MENRMSIPKPNSATHYDVWDNPPELEGQHPKFKLAPPGTFNQDPDAPMQWIAGYEGKYKINAGGHVYSVPRTVKSQVQHRGADTPTRTLKGRFLRAATNQSGVRYVVLQGNGKPKTRTIQSLIAETYGA